MNQFASVLCNLELDPADDREPVKNSVIRNYFNAFGEQGDTGNLPQVNVVEMSEEKDQPSPMFTERPLQEPDKEPDKESPLSRVRAESPRTSRSPPRSEGLDKLPSWQEKKSFLHRVKLHYWFYGMCFIVIVFEVVKIQGHINNKHLMDSTMAIGTLLSFGMFGLVYYALKVDERRVPEAILAIHARLIFVLLVRSRTEQVVVLQNHGQVEDSNARFFLFSFLSNETLPVVIILNSILTVQIIGNSLVQMSIWTFSILMILIKAIIKVTLLDLDARIKMAWTSVTLVSFSVQCLIFIFTSVSLQQLTMERLLTQRIENSEYKRIIDSVKEAMLIISKESLRFSNRRSNSLFFGGVRPAAEEFEVFFRTPLFRIYGEQGRQWSLSQLIERPSLLESEGSKQVFTLHESVARCREFSQLQKVLSRLQLEERRGFYLFTIELINLDEAEDRKINAVQIQDISEKVRSASLDQERVFLSYINAAISHEMRNPLTSILSVISDLKNQPSVPSSAFSVNLGILESSARMMDFNIENILSLAQAKEGRLFKNIKPNDLQREVEEAIRIIAPKADLLGVQIQTEFFGLEGAALSYFDSRRLQQVIFNLLSNSISSMDKKEGKILVHVARVEPSHGQLQRCPLSNIQAAAREFFQDECFVEEAEEETMALMDSGMRSQPRVQVTIMDNGAGMSEGQKKKLFHLFPRQAADFQISGSSFLPGSPEGLGIGLLISKMLTEEFGGRLSVFSYEGRGTKFQAVFSIGKPTEDRSRTLAEISPTRARSNPELSIQAKRLHFEERLSRLCAETRRKIASRSMAYTTKKILVVDDEPYNCLAIFSLLQSLQLEEVQSRVDLASSGREALALLAKGIHSSEASRQRTSSYSLILTDCSMPFMNGYELTENILSELEKAQVIDYPLIVAITGHAELEYISKAFESGIQQVYAKPVKREQLAALLLSQGFKFEIPEGLRSQAE